jgi:lipopolysaccharide/colanic/teichoic acid biosynthesis glycosyltransferase
MRHKADESLHTAFIKTFAEGKSIRRLPMKSFKQSRSRVTRFGRYLRKTSLDEPPAFNVLKGEK